MHVVDSADIFELRIDRRLQPDGKTVDARFFVNFHLFFADGAGVEFQRDFGVIGKGKAFADAVHGA